MPSALAVIALSERGTMFDPGPIVYMEKLAGADGHRRPARPRPPAGQDHRAGRRAPRRRTSATSWSSCSTAPATRRASQEIRDVGARVRLISDGDVSAALLAVVRSLARRPAVGRRRHAGGRHLRRGRSSRSAAGWSAGSGRATTTSARRRVDARLRPRPPAHPGRPRQGRRLLLRGDRRHRRRHAAGRPLPRRERRPPPSRWSCARAAGPSGASGAPRPRRSCAPSASGRYG